eukprot:scaffold136795_cov280-Phaeocystis_antarctica.AAC.1
MLPSVERASAPASRSSGPRAPAWSALSALKRRWILIVRFQSLRATRWHTNGGAEKQVALRRELHAQIAAQAHFHSSPGQLARPF